MVDHCQTSVAMTYIQRQTVTTTYWAPMRENSFIFSTTKHKNTQLVRLLYHICCAMSIEQFVLKTRKYIALLFIHFSWQFSTLDVRTKYIYFSALLLVFNFMKDERTLNNVRNSNYLENSKLFLEKVVHRYIRWQFW